MNLSNRNKKKPTVTRKKHAWRPATSYYVYYSLNVSVQCNGGLLPDIILLTLCDSIGEPFKYHVEFLSL